MHTVKVTYQDITLAKGILESDVKQLEGRYYFHPASLNKEVFQMKGQGGQYYCPVKQGKADYYNVVWDGKVLVDEAGWVYESLDNKDFAKIEGWMAFYGEEKGIEIEKTT